MACLVLTLAGVVASGDTIIKFDSQEQSGNGVNFLASHTEGGFTIVSSNPSSIAFGSPQQSSTLYHGSAALYNTENDLTLLTKDDAQTFSFKGISLSDLTPFPLPLTVVFTGTKSDDSTISRTVFVTGASFSAFTFSGFDDLKSLSFTNGLLNGVDLVGVEFDNIDLEVPAVIETPLPSASIAATVLLGAVALVRFAHRGRTAA